MCSSFMITQVNAMQRFFWFDTLAATRSLRSHRFSTSSALRNNHPPHTQHGPRLTPVRFGNLETNSSSNTPQLTPIRFGKAQDNDNPSWQQESFFMQWTTYISMSMCFALAGIYGTNSGTEITTPEQLPERRRLQPTLDGLYLSQAFRKTFSRAYLGIPKGFEYLQPPLTLPDDDPLMIAARNVLADLLRATRIYDSVYPQMRNIRAYVVNGDACKIMDCSRCYTSMIL